MKTRLSLLLFAMLALNQRAFAFSSGIAGYSGNPATNNGMSCDTCHGGGALPTVDLSGPMTVAPGSTNTYVLRITGGLFGSLDVSATLGSLAAFEAGTQLMNGEVVHSGGPRPAVNGETSFSFLWTAPQAPGTTTLFGAGLASNGNGTGGDEVARIALMITVDAPPAPNQPPVADPGGPYSGSVGLPILFDGSRSYDPDGTIASFEWDFGDGSLEMGAKPSHAYAAAGNFTVTLKVTDDNGATDTRTAMANVNDGTPQNQPPSAFAGGPYTGVVGVPLVLDGSGSQDPDGSVASYVWDFGDGNGGSGAKPTHVYSAPGAYSVTLTVVDNLGASASDSTSAAIRDASAGMLPVTLDAPPKFKVGSEDERLVKIRVAVDLSAVPAGTSGCGQVILFKNGQPVQTQQMCVGLKLKEKDDDDDEDDDRNGRKKKLKRERYTLRLKAADGVSAIIRPWRGSWARGSFRVPLTEADAPSIVIWTARAELAGLSGESQPATTEVRTKGGK